MKHWNITTPGVWGGLAVWLTLGGTIAHASETNLESRLQLLQQQNELLQNHAQMHCVILVLPNPCFAAADEWGRYSITNVPPGTYQLKAWHERLPAQIRQVVVPETGEARADFVLSITNLPRY